MEAPELAVKIGTVTNRRGEKRPFSNLSPVDSVMPEITVPGRFTRLEQIAVLRARGLTTERIGLALGIPIDSVRPIIFWQATKKGLTTTGVVVSLVRTGRLPKEALIEGLKSKRKDSLSELQLEALELISREDMWGATNKEIAFKFGITKDALWSRLFRMYHILGVKNRSQAIIYGLYMPLSKEGKLKMIAKRRLEVAKLRALDFDNEAKIADELHTTARTVKYDMAWLQRGYSSLIDAIISRFENGTLKATLAERVVPDFDLLSPNEQKILEDLLASRDVEGNKGIAKRLGFTEQYVKNNLSSIFEKLGVKDRVHAAVLEYLRVKGEARPFPRRQMSFSGIR